MDLAEKTINEGMKILIQLETKLQIPTGYLFLGELYLMYDQKDKALELFAELIEAAKKSPDALWGPLASESHKTILNDLQFDKYLKRTPTAANTE